MSRGLVQRVVLVYKDCTVRLKTDATVLLHYWSSSNVRPYIANYVPLVVIFGIERERAQFVTHLWIVERECQKIYRLKCCCLLVVFQQVRILEDHPPWFGFSVLFLFLIFDEGDWLLEAAWRKPYLRYPYSKIRFTRPFSAIAEEWFEFFLIFFGKSVRSGARFVANPS